MSPETRAYIRKTEAYRAGRAPLSIMKGHAARLERAIRGLSGAQLRRRPAKGKWSIAEILGHLVDTEIVYGYRYRMELAQPGSPIPGYDQAGWAATFTRRRREPKKMIEQIRALRAVNLDLVTSVPRSWWKRYGWHSERGRESVQRTLELIAGHDLNHLDQIRAIRKKYGW
ncbi:MAG: DinB family protein [Hyphomicrobiales bacterium]